MIDTANKIRVACGVDDWNTATEDQLIKRDKIHENVHLLCNVLKDPSLAVDFALDNI
jgi:hypothetical protein